MLLNGRSSWIPVALLLFLILPISSLANNDTVIVNVMIDVNSFSSPTPDQENLTHNSLINLTNALGAKRLNATYYLSGESIPVERLYLTYLGESPRRELAMGSMKFDEKLGSMSSSKQKDQLEKMKSYVKACHVCGGKTIEPKGFRPQSLSQNNATYQALAEIGIVYDAGFIAGCYTIQAMRETPGHISSNLMAFMQSLSAATISRGNRQFYPTAMQKRRES